MRVTRGLKVDLDHAVSCATLLSYVSTLDEGKRKEMFRELLDLRDTSRRWSQRARGD